MRQRHVLLAAAWFLLAPLSATAQKPDAATAPIATPPLATPTIKAFPRELLLNFRALASTENLAPLAVGVAATAAAKIPGPRVENYFGTKKEEWLFGEPGEYMGAGWITAPTAVGLFFLGQKSEDARFRSFTYSVAQGYVLNQTIALGIKHAVDSTRPNQENTLSFPSGHTSAAFTLATTVSHYYGFKKALPAYLAASYIGFTRLDERAHRLTDVVAGAALGYIVGKTVSRRANPEGAVHWNVMVPAGGGVGLALSYRPPW